jgi:hypothetical protein
MELGSQEDEKMEGPKTFNSPPLSNLLCRSMVVVAVVVEVVEVDDARGGVTIVVCHRYRISYVLRRPCKKGVPSFNGSTFNPMTRLTGPQSLGKTISLLGGPLFESNDIDWATDLPAGNAFFGWLADQLQLHDWSPNLELQNVTSGNVDDIEDGKTLEIKMCAALREMALEKDEVLVFVSIIFSPNYIIEYNHRLSHDSSLRDAFTANDVSDSDYMPPSRLECVPSNS